MTSREAGTSRRRLAVVSRRSATWAEAAWELPHGPLAAGAARTALRGWLAGLGIALDSEAADGIILAASELAGNAGVHGWPPVMLTAFAAAAAGGGPQVIVAVGDANPGVPLPRRAGDLEGNGRGMAIVDVLADWTDTAVSPDGKQVRFGVAVPGLPAPAGPGGTGDGKPGAFGAAVFGPDGPGLRELAS
jgi:hypothetical protein